MKRAVITGLGIVSSIGNNQQEVLASLREGRSGITFSEEFKDSGMRSHVWGNVKLDTTGLIDRKVVRFMNDASIYAYLSMQEAIKDSGLSEEVYQNNPRVGLIAGSGGSSKAQVFGADAMRSPRGLKAVGPYVVTKAMGTAVSACLATPFKIHGVNMFPSQIEGILGMVDGVGSEYRIILARDADTHKDVLHITAEAEGRVDFAETARTIAKLAKSIHFKNRYIYL